MSIFGGSGGKSPGDAAREYWDQIPGVAHSGYDPYINSGQVASKNTHEQYEQLLKDPAAFIDKIMQGYNTSEGYQFKKDQLTKDLGNTAAAGGIAGTPLDQMNQGQGINHLLSADMQDYLKNILDQYGLGLKGEEGEASRGFEASKSLTDTLGNSLNQQGEVAYKDQQQANQNKNDLWGMFGKALGAGAGAYLGGGLPGAAAGLKLFGGK